MYSYQYPRPAVTADMVVLHRAANGLEILLIERLLISRSAAILSWLIPSSVRSV